MPGSPRLVHCTCPDAACTEAIARALVERGLAACVGRLPGLTSVYRWQGKVETAAEHLLLIKTDAEHYPRLEAAIRELHPYEVPEIVAVPITEGLSSYLAWLQQNLSN
jgi:periplasmic divalent cation tolerance protein